MSEPSGRVIGMLEGVVLVASLSALLLLQPSATHAWTLELADSADVEGTTAKLGDLVSAPVPAEAAAVVIRGGGRPGLETSVSRQSILRRLMRAGLAADVKIGGADECRIRFAGGRVDGELLQGKLVEALSDWLPPGPPGAPSTWCGVDGLPPRPAVAGEWRLEIDNPRPLSAGRNLVRVRVSDSERVSRFTATVICHVYGEVGRARAGIARGEALDPEGFAWEWRDLATADRSLAIGRDSVRGMTAAGAVAAGDLLRVSAVRETPLVRQGDPVELVLGKNGVSVSVNGHARQDGLRDQIITVRNDLNGNLVTGRVVGPGLVAWKR